MEQNGQLLRIQTAPCSEVMFCLASSEQGVAIDKPREMAVIRQSPYLYSDA